MFRMKTIVAGLGEIGSSLYASSYNVPSGTLYSVNPANGFLTPIGAATTVDYSDFGSTLTTLYAVDRAANLWSIDPTTGVATSIGSTGLTLTGYQNLSTNSSTSYFGNGANLYTLNISSGAATRSWATCPRWIQLTSAAAQLLSSRPYRVHQAFFLASHPFQALPPLRNREPFPGCCSVCWRAGFGFKSAGPIEVREAELINSSAGCRVPPPGGASAIIDE
jgi:hypothetical protein